MRYHVIAISVFRVASFEFLVWFQIYSQFELVKSKFFALSGAKLRQVQFGALAEVLEWRGCVPLSNCNPCLILQNQSSPFEDERKEETNVHDSE